MKFPPSPAPGFLLVLGLLGCGQEAQREAAHDFPFPANSAGLDAQVLARFREAFEALQQTPEEADAWLHLGMTYEAHSQMQLAIDCYRSAAALEPSPRAEARMSVALASEGDLPGAQAAIERSIALKEDYAPSHLLLGSYLFDQGWFPEALAAYGRAKELAPDHLGGALGMARVELQQGNPTRAIELLLDNLERNPTEPASLRLLHTAYVHAGQPEKAEQLSIKWHSNRSLGADPWAREFAAYSAPPLMELAATELARGNAGAALELLEPFVQAHPEETNAQARLAWAYHANGETGRGLESINASLNAVPDDLLCLATKARIREAQGEYKDALALTSRMLEIDGDHLYAREQRARLYMRLKKPGQAIKDYQRMLKLDRSRMQIWVGLGEAQLEVERFEPAAESFRQALLLKPGAEAPFLGSLQAQWKLGDLVGAQWKLHLRKNLGPEGRLLLQRMGRAMDEDMEH